MKILKPLLVGALFTALSAQAADVNIQTARGDVTLAQNPAKIAVYDLSALDSIDALGVNIGASLDEKLDYLNPVIEKAVHVGDIFKPDIEALNAYQPNFVVIGGRSADTYNDVKKYFPNTVDMTLNNLNLFEDGLQRIEDYGKLFNKTAEADALKAKLTQLISDTQKVTKNKGKGLILLISGNKISAYGPKSRLGWVHTKLGVAEADKDIKDGRHGQPVSFEYIKKTNPDWLFVLDRGAAIGKEGISAAQVLDNPLVADTTAWKKGQVVYFSAAAYLAPGGARQIEKDVSTIKAAFEK